MLVEKLLKSWPVLWGGNSRSGKRQTQDCFRKLQELQMLSSVTLLKWVTMNVHIVLNCQKCDQVLNRYKSLGMIGELGVWVRLGELGLAM